MLTTSNDVILIPVESWWSEHWALHFSCAFQPFTFSSHQCCPSMELHKHGEVQRYLCLVSNKLCPPMINKNVVKTEVRVSCCLKEAQKEKPGKGE
jgi:hypothetical protein